MSQAPLEIEELKQDAEEARTLLASATRRRWKDVLSLELSKIESMLKTLETTTNKDTLKSPTIANPKAYTSIIRNYSWDQSEKFLKLYLTLPGVQNLKKENIECTFEHKGLMFKVCELDGKNQVLNIANFSYPIVPDKSHFKVKTDMVIIFAAKENNSSWEAVTAEETKAINLKKSKQPDVANKEDPTSGLMGLMKQMYDDGDDEMKRMLNKTWYESQQKGQGMPGMPGMPGGLPGMPGGMPGMPGGMPGMPGGMPNMEDMNI